MIFSIFDPFQKAQKWKLGQFLKYASKNIPSGVRKSTKFGNIALCNQIACPKNVKKNVISIVILVIFGIFDFFQKAQKWKLGQFLKYAIRNIPSGVRKSKKFGNIALNQIGHPKNGEKTNFMAFYSFFAFLTSLKRPKNEN